MIPYRRSWRCKDIKQPTRSPSCKKGSCVPNPPPIVHAVPPIHYDSTASKTEIIKNVFLMG